jgi:hypothetical protein
MLQKNTNFGALRGLALAGIVGACSVGVSNAAIMFSDVGGELHFTLDTTTTIVGATVWDIIGLNEGYTGAVDTALDDFSTGWPSVTAGGGAITFIFPGRIAGYAPLGASIVAFNTGVNQTAGDVVLSAGTYNLGVAYADFDTGLANYTFSVWEGTTLAGTSASISNVPEPSTFLLAGLGLFVFALRRNR